MITNHFFNLVQCYSEQGECYIFSHSFNPMLMPIIYIFLIGIVSIIGLFLWSKFRRTKHD